MSFDWNYMQASSAYRREKYTLEAQQSHLAALTRPRRKRIVRVYGSAMYRMGGLLMNWGRQLQAQYGELSTSIQDMGETPPEPKLALANSDGDSSSGC
jgi:hypothetical protein